MGKEESCMRICVVGGDDRLLLLTELIKKQGYETDTWGQGGEDNPKALTRAQAVVLPLPRAGRDGFIPAPRAKKPVPVHEVASLIGEGVWVMAGSLDEELAHTASQKDWRLLLPNSDPSFEEQNAMPSAEGAIYAAMQKADYTICGCTCLIIGLGRIGKELARMLRGIGARVFVAARREESLLLAKDMGCMPVSMETLPIAARETDILFNTAPASVAGEAVMASLPRHALAIDLASAPYGIDLDAAQRHGITAFREGGIPGKYAPRTAAKLLLNYFQAHTGSDG
jgi:dipicolinate synthase subunit A